MAIPFLADRKIELHISGKEEDVMLFLDNFKKAMLTTKRKGMWLGDLAVTGTYFKRSPESKSVWSGNLKFKKIEDLQ